MRILSKLHKKETKNRHVGLSENAQWLCLVTLENDNIQTYWQAKPYDTAHFLLQKMPFATRVKIVRSVPYHYIWRKYLLLPANYANRLIYQQIIHLLEQELPIPLADVYFDYVIQPLAKEQVIRVVVHALRKSYADSLLLNENTVLDCELYCFSRGVDYVFAENNAETATRDYCMYGKRFHFALETLDIKEDAEAEFTFGLPNDIVDPHLYLTALGACLWNGEA